MDLVEHLLAEAISDCYSAMEKLGERGSDSRTWDHISAELAMAYLTVRKLLFYLAFDHSDFDVLLSLSLSPHLARCSTSPNSSCAVA
jgi:hypothetical protein